MAMAIPDAVVAEAWTRAGVTDPVEALRYKRSRVWPEDVQAKAGLP